jgi:hypothetical protein
MTRKMDVDLKVMGAVGSPRDVGEAAATMILASKDGGTAFIAFLRYMQRNGDMPVELVEGLVEHVISKEQTNGRKNKRNRRSEDDD